MRCINNNIISCKSMYLMKYAIILFQFSEIRFSESCEFYADTDTHSAIHSGFCCDFLQHSPESLESRESRVESREKRETFSRWRVAPFWGMKRKMRRRATSHHKARIKTGERIYCSDGNKSASPPTYILLSCTFRSRMKPGRSSVGEEKRR